MPYPSMSSKNARAWLEGQCAEPDVVEKPAGPTVAWEVQLGDASKKLEKELEAVESILGQIGVQAAHRKRHPAWQAFDARAAKIVHDAIPSEHEAVCDWEFWIWAACIPLRGILKRRYAGLPEDKIELGNYGISSYSENFVYRSWLRAEICTIDSETGPSDLVFRGGSDFWRSHIFRQRYAASPVFARTLLTIVYPFSEDPRKSSLTTDQVRELAKRLRKIGSNLLFPILDEGTSRTIIQEEIARIRNLNSGYRESVGTAQPWAAVDRPAL